MKQHEQTQMLLRKAAADETLLDQVLSAENVDDEIIGFHCQQAVEKLLKAWLSDLGVNYPKTHNLQTLVELLEQQGKTFPKELADVDRLTPYATILRYEDPPQQEPFDRAGARKLVQAIRVFVESQLRLQNPP